MTKPLFERGEFTLHSGQRTRWRINCEALTDEALQALADTAAGMLPPFSRVIGIPTGGTRLAEALKRHCVDGGKVLVVDDVITTGSSMQREYENFSADDKPIGLVIFARGKVPSWVTAMFQTHFFM